MSASVEQQLSLCSGSLHTVYTVQYIGYFLPITFSETCTVLKGVHGSSYIFGGSACVVDGCPCVVPVSSCVV